MAIGLTLPDEEHFLPSHSGHNNQLRLLHYPPVALADIDGQEATLTRMPAHSDWGSLTMVFQDNVGGLEVRKKMKLKFKKYLQPKTNKKKIRPASHTPHLFFSSFFLFPTLMISSGTGRRPQPPWQLYPRPTRSQLYNHERRRPNAAMEQRYPEIDSPPRRSSSSPDAFCYHKNKWFDDASALFHSLFCFSRRGFRGRVSSYLYERGEACKV